MTQIFNIMEPTGRRVQKGIAGVSFMSRSGTHWGEDLRPVVKGKAGDLLYMPCRARIVAVGRGTGARGSRLPYHSGKYVLAELLGSWGGDRMFLYVGHVADYRVKPGQVVGPGHIFATMGGSGAKSDTDFGVHAHVGVIQNTDRPYTPFNGHTGWIDPVDWFALRGVSFDSSAPFKAVDKPVTVSPASTTRKDWLAMATKAEVREIVKEETTALYDRLVTYGGLSWAKVGHNGENLRALLWQAATGAQASFVNTNEIKASNAEVAKAVAEASKAGALSPEQVEALIARTATAAGLAAEKGAADAVEAGVTVELSAEVKTNTQEA